MRKAYGKKRQDIIIFKRTKGELLDEYQLVKIGLFASFARDEATAESDIDLLVEFESNTENLSEKKLKIKSLIEKQFHRDVDLCREKYIKS